MRFYYPKLCSTTHLLSYDAFIALNGTHFLFLFTTLRPAVNPRVHASVVGLEVNI